VTFFFDQHHSHRIVRALRELGIDAIHLQEVFGERSVDDVIWIAKAAEEHWVVITADQHIKTRKAEKAVFRKAGLITFFVAEEYNSKQGFTKFRWIVDQWEKIQVAAATAQPGDCFRVPLNGKLRKDED
jgi:predicted nuclease of predicted toxin-antitoxin system